MNCVLYASSSLQTKRSIKADDEANTQRAGLPTFLFVGPSMDQVRMSFNESILSAIQRCYKSLNQVNSLQQVRDYDKNSYPVPQEAVHFKLSYQSDKPKPLE